MSERNRGICKLTGNLGQFVKSHILPASLTKPAYPGAMLFQHGSGLRAQKRRTSWYDAQIVCADGEKILSELDDWGIKFLRQAKLVWSGFGPANRIEPDVFLSDLGSDLSDYGIRTIAVSEPEMLRRFMLSLLWRASVSQLQEMSEVQLDKDSEEQLTRYLVGDADLPLKFFPCWLTQHHQIGFPHNQTPIKWTKAIPSINGSLERQIDIYRFYFDGLVLHFHDTSSDDADEFANCTLTVGYDSELLVTCVPWDRSAQLENLKQVAQESLW